MPKLKRIVIENSGPIEKIDVSLSFTEEGLPKPLVLVGENGAGKTTTLSFLVDSLLQLAASKYSDVLATNNGQMGNLFYRLRSHDVKIGASFSIAHISYDFNGRQIDFVDRVGKVTDLDQLLHRLNLPHHFPLNPELPHEKSWTQNADEVGAEIREGAYAFFPSGRREIPHWLQVKALHSETYTHAVRFDNQINKPLVIETAAAETAKWIMDGLLDKAAGYPDSGIEVANSILQTIIEDPEAHFAVASRNIWPRVQIYTGSRLVYLQPTNPRRLVIPSLGHLSAGQSMLLSMFGTIANHGTLVQRKNLQDIEGIAIIDEAEVYLHTHLQRSVLPTLIKQFPKVQFVISTHSPSFLMGMKDKFGSAGFNVIDMPTGTPIDVDQFSEIGAAVETLRETTAFRNQVRSEIAREVDQPLLVVEGRSDAIIIEGLWRAIMNTAPPFRIMNAKGRRALRYLLEDEDFVSEVGENQIVLGLFDFDEAFDDWNGCQKNYPNKLGDEATGLLRRNSAKQIYTGLLPVPKIRATQAGERFGANSNFTIELYLPDDLLISGQNLETLTFPGDVQVAKFRGDKVAFAERIAGQKELHVHFEALLVLIRKVLQV